jgi:oligoendopeptidase F
MKRILTFLLALFLLIGCTHETVQPQMTAYHTDLSFSELTESGESVGLEIARMKELLFRIERGELSGERAQQALDARTEIYETLSTDAALAYVRYCLDVTDAERKQRYDTLSVELDTLRCLLVDAALLLSGDPTLSEYYDAETVERLSEADRLSDPKIQPLLIRERELVGQYEALPETLSVERNGRSWTGDEILSDPTLSDADFAALYERYMALFNAEAGSIFLELVAVRNAVAESLGFGSYAEYAYACYGRDYTPSDAKTLAETVRTFFAPMLQEIRRDFYAAAASLYGAVFEQDPTMDRIREAIVSLVPELHEPWAYMLTHKMYDLSDSRMKMPGSFTTYFDTYGAPFLFSAWTNGSDVPPAVIHEFGHFAAYYLNGETLREGNVLDLAEIDSQGLELMTVLRYDTIYGDLSEEAADVQLFYALYALIDGCLEDEFQQFAYEQDALSLEQLNTEYGRLCEAYGLDLFGLDARSWTQIPHTFQSPFYYISYATSMSAALELYLLCNTDPDEAVRIYRTILMRPKNATFRQTLLNAGLCDPFDADRMIDTARTLGRLRQNGRNEGANGAENGR